MHLPERNAAVDRLAGKVNKLTARHQRELQHLLGRPPSLANVPASFWTDVQREMDEEIAAALALLFLAAVSHHGGDVDAVEAAAKIHGAERARIQAERYAGAIKGRTETLLAGYPGSPQGAGSGDGLGGRIGSSRGPDGDQKATKVKQIDLGELMEELGKTFDAQAERIAASETTNAETAGGDAAQVTIYGDVSQDDIWRAHPSRTKSGTCARCKRLDGTKRKEWGRLDEEAAGGPMLHEHCACTIEYAAQPKPDQQAA